MSVSSNASRGRLHARRRAVRAERGAAVGWQGPRDKAGAANTQWQRGLGGVRHEAGEPVQDEYTVLRGKVTRTCRGQKGWGTADTSVVFMSAGGEVNLSTRRDAEERELEGGSGPRPGGPPLPL